MSKTGLSHTDNVSVDGVMIENLLKMMQNNNISSLSVPELVEHLATMKLSQGTAASNDGPATPRVQESESAPFSATSPDFSFKSPSNVFTPFKMGEKKDNTKKSSKLKDSSGVVFNVDSESDSDAPTAPGPFSGTAKPAGPAYNSGSFYTEARDSIPGNANETSRPSTSEGGLFATAGLNSLGTSSLSGSHAGPSGVQFHMSNPASTKPSSKSSTNKSGANGGSAPKPQENPFVFGQPAPAPATSVNTSASSNKDTLNGNSWFWGDKAPAPNTKASAGPFSSTSRPSNGGNGLFANTTANVMNSTNTPSASSTSTANSIGGLPLYAEEPRSQPSSLGQQPFTFTIGADGSTAKHNNGAKISTSKPSSATTTARDPAPAPAPSGYSLGSGDLLSSSKDKTSQPTAASSTDPFSRPQVATAKASIPVSDLHAVSAESEDAGHFAAEPTFPVYTLGDNDILHTLNDYSSDEDSEGDTASESGVPRNTYATFKAKASGGTEHAADRGFEFVFEDDEMSMDDGEEGDELRNFDTPRSAGPAVHPFPAAAPQSTSAASAAPATGGASGGAKNEFTFLFNGQSGAASMSQFEKENLNMFDFPQSNLNGVKFNIGSSGNQTTATPSAFDPQATYDRVSQAFAGLNVNPPVTSSATAAPPAATTPQAPPATTASACGSRPASAAPVLPPFAVPTSTPRGSASAGLDTEVDHGLGAGLGARLAFNIGKSVPAAPAPTAASNRKSAAKKMSPAKRKPSSSSAKAATNGVDSSSNNSVSTEGRLPSAGTGHVDEAPLWWTQAKAASDKHSTGENITHIFAVLFFIEHCYVTLRCCACSVSAAYDLHILCIASDFGDLHMPRDLLSDTGSDNNDSEDSEFSSFDAGEVEAPDEDLDQDQQSAQAGAPYVFRGQMPTAPSPKSQKTPAKASPPKAAYFQHPLYSQPQSAKVPETSNGAQGTGAGPSRPTTGAAGKTKTTAPPQKQPEEQSEGSMAHLAELYSKQGKDLYSSGSYARLVLVILSRDLDMLCNVFLCQQKCDAFINCFCLCVLLRRALDAYNKCLNLAPDGWIERATALGNRAAVLVMLHR